MWRSGTLLSGIRSPEDVKKIPEKDLSILAAEIRKKIISTVSKNGGHLASNLGVVELTIALHRVFESPKDAIIFDVSHQCYTHKLLTGRYREFDSIRKKGGISGFTRITESPHDYFDNGHSSTSISQALGLLTAWNLSGKEGKVVAVIGDGALTGGMAFEALSHAGQLSKNLIVVLNDNEMSISKNTGAISKYLSLLSMSSAYQRIRRLIDCIIDKIPYSEHHLGKFAYRFKRSLKGLFFSNNLFSDFGFEYVGPLDGHNIKELEEVFRQVKVLPNPVVVHIRTKKGKGYRPAEDDPSAFHGIGPFLISDGKVEKFDTMSFTESFSRTLLEAATKEPRLTAITAAMAKGTGLDVFSRHYPERFFDVGIAEEHAVTFSAALARGGMIPVCAIYSTFLQRAVDQIIHDAALSNEHVIFAVDRAGAVPADGETHQGIFDIAILRPVPNLQILSPASAKDLSVCFNWALVQNGPVEIRYPKASCPSELEPFSSPAISGRGLFISKDLIDPPLSAQVDEKGEKISVKKVLLVCTGGIFAETRQAARGLLLNEIACDIYSLRFIKPFDENYFLSFAMAYNAIVIVEDAVKTGGIGEYIQNSLYKKSFLSVKHLAFPDRFFAQGTRAQILEDAGLSPDAIIKAATNLLS